uniref:Proteasome maturation factor UMP1 n=1 Tax=virus sp. ctBM815 TaxID=2825806 RepID=A0A8S5RKW3_9VIRU|nr:MAG TPA: Proteasome maturation factor UMP1 [virus sp. ctBM815]
MAVANDEDGYEGIQFCRYIADIIGKDDTIDWNDFI